MRRLCLVVSESEAVATLPGPVWVFLLPVVTRRVPLDVQVFL